MEPRVSKVFSMVGVTALAAALLTVISPTTNAQAAYSSSTSGIITTLTFSYVGSVERFTIPANVTEVTLTVTGAEGGRGGQDYSVRPLEAGYKGVVSGTIPVTPGEQISVAVGQKGSDPVATGCTAGPRSDAPGSNASTGGANPLAAYAGGGGGAPGPDGCSGYGGAGGAASVVQIGTVANPSASALIVAGGSGGSGGNGQFAALQGGLAQASFLGRTDIVSTNGQTGLNTYTACVAAPRPDGRCDGGGGAGAGGGAQGGKRGEVPFGTGTNTEWYGLGAYPGQNSTSGFVGLSASYNYYTYSGLAGKRDGSVTISYSSGVPSAPTGVGGSVSNSGVNLYWTAPSNQGAAAISGYRVEYSTSPYSSWTSAAMCTGTGTTCNVTNLTNGTGYKFRVGAQNSIDWGAYSALSGVLTPSGPPAAPTISSITPSDGALSVAFTAGASTAPITDYQYSIDAGQHWFSLGATASPVSISGLQNGSTYSVLLRAVNSVGYGAESASTSGTPSALPGAPTITSVTPGVDGTSLVVEYVAGYSGGSTISDYEYAVSVGLNSNSFGSYVSVGSTTSPFTISGLTSGTTYTVKLHAINAAGAPGGPGSAYVTGATLARPSAPTITGIVSGDGRLTISYSAYDLTTNGGSAISLVEYSTDGGSTWSNAGTLATTFSVIGLANGTTYAVKLRATNAIGASVSSTSRLGTPATSPTVPRQVTVIAGQSSATVSWLEPASSGGAAITGYVASAFTASTGGSAVATCSTTGLTCVISGLTNGTTYYISVAASNSVGSGVASSPRISALPAAAPGAPTITSVTAGNAYLSVAFTAGSVDANAPITAYQYSTDGGLTWSNSPALASPIVVSSLTNGTTYTVKIRAQSNIGAGAASNPVSGTPFTVPSNVDPGTISYVAGSGSVTVNWTAPNSNGSSISSSYVTAFSALVGGSSSGTCSTTNANTSCTISGLSNGTVYYVSIETVNGAGYSQRSTPRVAIMPGSSSSTTLATSSQSVAAGSRLNFTASVTSGATGTVNFTTDGTTIVGCGSVAVITGTASCSTDALDAGSHTLRANYSGNSTYASSVSTGVSVQVLNRYTVTYDNRGGSNGRSSDDFTVGSSALQLPTPTRTSYVFKGWYDAASGGNRIGGGGSSFTPVANKTMYAQWVQTSLWGLGASTKIGTITTVNGVGNSYSANSSGTSVQLTYQADALPASTVLDVYLLADSTRAQSLITSSNSFVVNLVVAWKAADESVPNTASGKPLTLTISNPLIKAGAKLYALLGDVVTDLGTAVQDGQATVEITQDPEIVIANQKPDAPQSATAVAGDSSATVSWQVPSSNGGDAITGYSVLANTGQTCSTTTLLTCIVNGLTNGVAYTFTVTATNGVGTSDPSLATGSVTPAAAIVIPGGGGGSGGSTSPAPETKPEVPVSLPQVTYTPSLAVAPTRENPVLVTIGGAPVKVDFTQNTRENSISLSAQNWQMKIGASAAILPSMVVRRSSTTQNAIVATSNGRAVISGIGLMPDSLVKVYVFSSPIYLGTVTSDSAGNFSGSFPIPAGLDPGDHTLQLGAYNREGALVTASVAMVLKSSVLSKVQVFYFAPGSSVLSIKQKSQLDLLARKFSALKTVSVSAWGFVQKTSSSLSDRALANSRARVAVAYLRSKGLKATYRVGANKVAFDTSAKARRAELTFTWAP